MEKIIKLLVALSGFVVLGIIILQCESCTDDKEIPAPHENSNNLYAGTTWVSKRFEIILSGSSEDDEVRMSMPTTGDDMSLEFLPQDDYFLLIFGENEVPGKYKVIGGDRLISLKPDKGEAETLTVDTGSKQKKLLLRSSGNDAREFLAVSIAASFGGNIPPMIAEFLRPGGDISIKMRAEFIPKVSK